ncbi:PEP-CTERM sorting domain-containing protein [Paucibacter sp. KBW04]|uniref:cistern family PEP-CTERM protein n=1 Tax=Paucibacter sp. KBW04 TaxID=2153361 RepID=UPI000F57FE0B|nr:cistern family PEP-CTERM protein [Paucibacter sp. KBW04]RQO58016.1 PEP-CTERM sorting domain-containing protein [Paucibacter sp. KBW04]
MYALKSLAAATLAVLTSCGLVQASTVSLAQANDSFSLLFTSGVPGATLSATAKFTLTSISANSATLAMHISNDSFGAGLNELTSLGVDVVTPGLTGATANNGWAANTYTTLPGFQQVDLCIWGGQGCQGGGQGMLAMGSFADFTLSLTTSGDFTANGISFTSPYGAKFQAAGTTGNSYEFTGCIVGTSNCGDAGVPPSQIPEPNILVLVGLALLSGGLRQRNRT